MSFAAVADKHGRWAMAALGWSPHDFWLATPADVQQAWQGWCALHGANPDGTACDRTTFDSLLAQFPD
jgi:hypothetical protein